MENISIIMLSHNNQDIDLCILALAEQLRQEDEFVIVDDHSNADILNEKVMPYLGQNIKLLHAEEYRGNRSYNRNLGVKNTQNSILLFVDGDMLLCENALNLLRYGYDSSHHCAFIGTEHGMKYTDIHMSLSMGNNWNYRELIKTKKGRAFLFQHPLLSDWRKDDLSSPQYADYYWIYYYTSFCSMTRTAFQAVGGFDEAFITWGSEDVDIGYRLSQHGSIGYLPGFEGLHIPHPRNIWRQEIFDRDNIRYILDKYRVWQLELLAAFDSSCRLYDQMEKIYREIRQWPASRISVRKEADSLWVNLPNAGEETLTTQWFDTHCRHFSAPLLGIALPFCDLRFENAYLTSDIFAYPAIVTARILMESIRVSRHAYLCPAPRPFRKAWEDDAFTILTSLHRVNAISSDPMEYGLEPRENGLIEVLAPENRARLVRSFSCMPVLPSAEARQKWKGRFANGGARTEYTLIDLTETGADLVKDKLQNAFGFKIELCYDMLRPKEDCFTLEQAVPLALCQSPAPLLYFVPDARQLRKSRSWQRNNPEDLVFDQIGMLYSCQELEL